MNNLVAIGTAAVLTVYAAGYLKTRGAALRFAEAEAAARRPPSAAVPVGESAVATVAAVPPPVRPETVAIVSATDSQHGNPAVVATSPSIPAGTGATAEPALAVADSSAAKTPAGDSTPAVPPKDVATPVAAAMVDSVSAQAAADTAGKRGPYRDGQYFGWGTSRHGDIQAGIEIKDGHITGAWVAQCLTRYSCSWIAALPGQVVARQSPETDFISGATQSTNAFYYGVVEALSKAK